MKLVTYQHADDCTIVEAGGLLAAADLLVETRQRYRADAIRSAKFGRRVVALVSHDRLSPLEG